MPMHAYRIWSDVLLSEQDRGYFCKNLGENVLLETRRPPASVLHVAEGDELLMEADIALGQPDPEAVLNAPKLKWLQITSAGYTRYDTEDFRCRAREKGLVVTNSSLVYDTPCAEHVLAFMLAQSRGLPHSLGVVCAPGEVEWFDLRRNCRLLRGGRVLILGYGSIGEKLAPVLIALGMEVVGVRRKPTGEECVPVVSVDRMGEFLGETDHVVNILPDSPSTRGFVDRAFLAKVKKGAVFYNIGRGATVDQEALTEALVEGKLAAAWLDVSDPEPLPMDHPLRLAPNCHITPHIGGGFAGEQRSVLQHFLENLERFSNGRELLNRIM